LADFVVDFSKHGDPSSDGRLNSPAFQRNHQPILEVLERLLSGGAGDVLEIGCGTGQHVAAFAEALPHLIWRASDPNSAHVASAESWARYSKLANILPPLQADASTSDWGIPIPGDGFRAILCFNVIHIAPWSVAEGLFAGAARILSPDGVLVLYGPFSEGGAHTAPSNAAFDQSLRREDPAWGIRDISEIENLAKEHGLFLNEAVQMPVNNQILVLTPIQREQ